MFPKGESKMCIDIIIKAVKESTAFSQDEKEILIEMLESAEECKISPKA